MDKYETNILEFKNYIQEKFNIDVYIKKPRKCNIVKNVNDYIIYSIVLCGVILVLLYIYFRKNIIKNKYYRIFFLIIIFIITIHFLIFFSNIITYFNNNKKFKNNENVDFIVENIDYFKTGDIIQDACFWNFPISFILYFITNYFHSGIIIKYNEMPYILHYVGENMCYPNNIIGIQGNKYIEISPLEDYLNSHKFVTEYFHIIRPGIDIQTDNILNVLSKQLDNKFSFIHNQTCNTTYNCCSFILDLLIKMQIIPEMNINYYLPDNFHFLKPLSNGKYNESYIIKNNIIV